jgi:hypothetical protein
VIVGCIEGIAYAMGVTAKVMEDQSNALAGRSTCRAQDVARWTRDVSNWMLDIAASASPIDIDEEVAETKEAR